MRSFLPLMLLAGVAVSLTAPLEAVFARDASPSGLFIGVFMLSAAVGIIAVDVFGTRLIPALDARVALTAGLVGFGLGCVGLGLSTGGTAIMASRVLQGVGGGVILGAGLQAAVRVRPVGADVAHSVGRFNAAFLFGGAVGSPGGLVVAGLIDGRLGYQAAFVGTGALTLCIAAMLAVVLPRLPAAQLGWVNDGARRRFTGAPASRAVVLLAMSGDFLRGGVLLTALPLAGAVLRYSTLTISIAVALMSGVEIVVLSIAFRYVRGNGVVGVLIASFALGTVCAMLLVLVPGVPTYLVASALFGVSLAGATVSLPVLVVAHVGESAAGLAKFRISAGVGFLAGSVGCGVLGAELGVPVLFATVAIVLLACALLARGIGRRTAAE